MRAKPIMLLAVAATGALALLGGSQTWVSFMIDSTHSVETVVGNDVNQAVTPVAIALIAAALALTIAGAVFRRVLGVLVALLGIGIVALTVPALTAPLDAIGARVTDLTGITGAATIDAVVWHDVGVWVWVTIAAGALALFAGVAVLGFGGTWASGGRKYESASRQGPQSGAPDRISDWDALSGGDDPSDEIR